MTNRSRVGRLSGRLFYWLIWVLSIVAMQYPAEATAPTTTVISDIVYRGDGTPAQGTVLISWPAFVTAERKAVAAGSMSLNIGTGGSLNLALIPNEGSTPARTYYKVLLKLDDLKNEVHALIGNGQPGRIRVLEVHVEQHEKFMQRASGLAVIIVPAITVLQFVLYYLQPR